MSESEIAVAIASAILDDRQNPGMNLPFQPHTLGLLARLGVGDRSEEERRWKQSFIEANREPDLGFRLAEYCWRLVGLGYLVPRLAADWGTFLPTARGRDFLTSMDPVALTTGRLDQRLSDLGFAPNDAPRQYARQAQHCFLAGHYEASIVMLGVANEAIIHLLTEAFSRVRPTAIPSLRALPPRATARQRIEWLAQALGTQGRKELRAALSSKAVDPECIESLRDLLSGTSQVIRLTRNELGHPTGFSASQEDALQLLVLFPRFADASTACINALAVFRDGAPPTAS